VRTGQKISASERPGTRVSDFGGMDSEHKEISTFRWGPGPRDWAKAIKLTLWLKEDMGVSAWEGN